MKRDDYDILRSVGWIRFCLYKAICFLVDLFFKDMSPEFQKVIFQSKLLREISIDPSEIFFEEGWEKNYYCVWRNYRVWVANEDYALRLESLDGAYTVETKKLPIGFRKALYHAYQQKKMSASTSPLVQNGKFYVPSDSVIDGVAAGYEVVNREE